MQVKNSVVMVTGASAGIGRATAEQLARAGANVVVTARRRERLDALVDALSALPGRRLAITGDVGYRQFAADLVGQTLERFGRLDVLINNAGVGYKGALSSMPADDIQQLLDTNIRGLLYVTQAAVTPMKQQRHGQIINVSSIVGDRPLPDSTLYCASKAAVNAISRGLRMELKPYNVTVSTLYPGLTATEFADARLGIQGGNRFGLRGVPAERVGRTIVKAIQYERQEIYVTAGDWLFIHLNRLFPLTLDRFFAAVTKWS